MLDLVANLLFMSMLGIDISLNVGVGVDVGPDSISGLGVN